jgi:hypothetical protein
LLCRTKRLRRTISSLKIEERPTNSKDTAKNITLAAKPPSSPHNKFQVPKRDAKLPTLRSEHGVKGTARSRSFSGSSLRASAGVRCEDGSLGAGEKLAAEADPGEEYVRTHPVGGGNHAHYRQRRWCFSIPTFRRLMPEFGNWSWKFLAAKSLHYLFF